MASWSLLPALSGFRCDGDSRTLHFDPVHTEPNGRFQTLFICGAGWGIYAQEGLGRDARQALTVLGGNLDGFTVHAGGSRQQIANGQLAPGEVASNG
jgi:hypothetical protein